MRSILLFLTLHLTSPFVRPQLLFTPKSSAASSLAAEQVHRSSASSSSDAATSCPCLTLTTPTCRYSTLNSLNVTKLSMFARLSSSCADLLEPYPPSAFQSWEVEKPNATLREEWEQGRLLVVSPSPLSSYVLR